MLGRLGHDQAGGAMTAFLIVLWAFLGLTALGLTVMGILLTHVRAMNAADAAAEGALAALRAPVAGALDSRSAANLAAFWVDVNQQVSDQADQWEADYRAAREADLAAVVPPLTPDAIQAVIHAEVSSQRPGVAQAIRQSLVWARKPAVAEQLLAGSLPLRDRLQHFLSADEVGCLVKQVAESNQAPMVAGAGAFAIANGAEPPPATSVELESVGTVQVSVRVPYRIRYFVLDRWVDESRRYLAGTAAHQLWDVAGIPVQVPPWCP